MADEFTVRANINAKDNASGVFNRFSKNVSRSLKLAVAAAVVAAAAFGAASLKWGVDFEAQMSEVKAISQATIPEIGAMSLLAQQLGRDSAFSAKEAGEAMTFLAMAGFNVDEILIATADTLNLAAAGSMELARAADIASNVLTGFGLPAEEMERVTDVMALTAADANTDIEQMGEALSYVAPQAAAAGWSLESTSAAIGMLGNAGIQGSRAGTTLRQMIVALAAPTDAARIAMNALSLSVVDANGNLMPLHDILAQIDPAAISTAKGLGYVNDIFGKRGAPGLIAMVKQGADNFVTFEENLLNASGSAKTMADTKLDNLKGAFTLIKSSVQALGIALTTGEGGLTSSIQSFLEEGLIPTVNAMAEWVGQIGGLPGLIKMAGEILVIFKDEALLALKNIFTDWEIFKGFVLNMAEALGLIIISIGTFASYILKSMVEVATVLWLPFIAPFAIVVSQIKAIFILLHNWLGAKVVGWVTTITEGIRGLLGKIGIEVASAEINWEPITVEPALTMENSWADSWTAVGETFVTGKDNIIEGAKVMVEGFGLAGESMVGAVAIANPELLSMGERIDEVVVKQKASVAQIAELGIATEEATESASEALTKHIKEDLSRGSKLWNALLATGMKITSSMSIGWKNYINTIPSLAESIGAGMELIGNAISTSLSDAFVTAIQTGKITFKDGMKAIGDAGARALGDALSAQVMENLIGPAVSKLVLMFSGGFDSILGKAGGFAGSLGGAMGGGGTGGMGVGAGGGLLTTAGLGVGVLGAGYLLGTLLDSWINGPSKTIGDQVENWKSKHSIGSDADIIDYLTSYLNKSYLDSSGRWKTGDLQVGLLRDIVQALPEEQYSTLLGAGGNVMKWAKSLKAGDWKSTGAGSTLITPKYHTGGVLNEGYFLGLSGEGVLNRRAMSNIGAVGLQDLNEGKQFGGDTYNFVIQAWDGEDVERVLTEKIIPSLKDRSQDGEGIMFSRGLIREEAI